MDSPDTGSKDQIEFDLLDVKQIGLDTVTFKLEDGATINIRVNIERAGIATNYLNSDGSKHYNVQASMAITVISPERKYKISKTQVKVPSTHENTSKPYG